MRPEDFPKQTSTTEASNDKREGEITYGPAPPLPLLQEWINAYKEQGIMSGTESLVFEESEPAPAVPPKEAEGWCWRHGRLQPLREQTGGAFQLGDASLASGEPAPVKLQAKSPQAG